jgi:gliding motility-associated-like protein
LIAKNKHIIFVTTLLLSLVFNIKAQVFKVNENKNNSFYLTENKGQWDSDIKYKYANSVNHILFKPNQICYYFLNEENVSNANRHLKKGEKELSLINGHYLMLNFESANNNSIIIPSGQAAPFYKNYYIGSNPQKWQSKVQSFCQVTYQNIYQNIDLKVSTKGDIGLKYDWVIRPNADLDDIKLNFQGADTIYSQYNELYIKHSQGILKEQKPFAYQIINGRRILVNVYYAINKNTVSFNADSYNKNYELIIDPDLIFSTYSGATDDNFGFTATYDSEGNLYAGGVTTDAFGGEYPVTAGAFQLTYKGGDVEAPVNLACDITISKYSSDGKQLIYATYLGGIKNEYPHSLVADNNDNLVIMGTSKSVDFPISADAYDNSQNGDIDIIVSKLSKDGTTLIGSTFMGGLGSDGLNIKPFLNTFYADEFRGDAIIDKQNNIIIGSCSFSTDFPITSGSFGAAIPSAIQKGVVFKLSPTCNNLIFSAAMTGNSEDVIYSVDLNQTGDIFIAGTTTGNMQIPTATNSFIGGNSDGFFAKIKFDGSTILKAKYFGTIQNDQVFSLELDNNEDIYIVGNSLGNIAPIGNVYSVTNGKQFISKINNDFSTINFISTFGRGATDVDLSINAFLLDDCGRLYISGWGGSDARFRLGGNTNGLPITNDAFQKTTDGNDFYLMVLGQNAEKILYATFFGGNSSPDHVDGGTSRFDKKGYIYQSVCASCPASGSFLSDFPTNADAVFKTNVSPRCSNAAFKMSFRFNQATIEMKIDTCAKIVTLGTPIENALNYLWLLPNGKTSILKSPMVTIDEINNKEIVLILNANTNCADTAKQTLNYNESLNNVKFSNVFTPNNDGINDLFFIDGISQCGEYELTFFNRWGQEIFITTTNQPKWDGKTTNGQDALAGIYYYLGYYKKQNEPKVKLHGTVTLIR